MVSHPTFFSLWNSSEIQLFYLAALQWDFEIRLLVNKIYNVVPFLNKYFKMFYIVVINFNAMKISWQNVYIEYSC